VFHGTRLSVIHVKSLTTGAAVQPADIPAPQY